jgi:peroxiredoxin
LSSGFWQRHGPKQAQAELDPEEIARRQPVKDFTILDSNGKQHLLSEYRGSVVILSFWASWCTPCLVELPSFADLQKKFKNDGLKVIAVNMDDGDEGQVLAKDFWAKKEFPFPCFFDQTKKLAEQFEVEMLPSNFVIDRKGRLVFSSFGANDWMSAQTTDFLEGLLAEGE